MSYIVKYVFHDKRKGKPSSESDSRKFPTLKIAKGYAKHINKIKPHFTKVKLIVNGKEVKLQKKRKIRPMNRNTLFGGRSSNTLFGR